MKHLKAISLATALFLVIASVPGFAGQGKGGGGGTSDRPQHVERKSEQARVETQDRDRGRRHEHSGIRDEDIYGGALMTREERNEYREQLRRLESEDERLKFQAQHKEQMDQRAVARDVEVEEAE